MRIRTATAVLIMAVAAASGCDKLSFLMPKKPEVKKPVSTTSTPLAVKGTVVARVNNLAVTLEDLNQEAEAVNLMVEQATPGAPAEKIDTRDKKLKHLKEVMIPNLLYYQNALDQGFDRKDDVARAIDRSKQQVVLTLFLADEANKLQVSSTEISDFYKQYKDYFKEPEERMVREMVVATEAEAKDILIQLLQGSDFGELAKQRSKAPTAANGGDLGYIRRDAKFPQFDAEAFSDTLEVGKNSNYFKGPDGYYIIKLEGKRGGKVLAESEVWDQIKYALTMDKLKKYLDDLKTKLSQQYKIEVNEGEIK